MSDCRRCGGESVPGKLGRHCRECVSELAGGGSWRLTA